MLLDDTNFTDFVKTEAVVESGGAIVKTPSTPPTVTVNNCRSFKKEGTIS
jgi:hypothetical protein